MHIDKIKSIISRRKIIRNIISTPYIILFSCIPIIAGKIACMIFQKDLDTIGYVGGTLLFILTFFIAILTWYELQPCDDILSRQANEKLDDYYKNPLLNSCQYPKWKKMLYCCLGKIYWYSDTDQKYDPVFIKKQLVILGIVQNGIYSQFESYFSQQEEDIQTEFIHDLTSCKYSYSDNFIHIEATEEFRYLIEFAIKKGGHFTGEKCMKLIEFTRADNLSPEISLLLLNSAYYSSGLSNERNWINTLSRGPEWDKVKDKLIELFNVSRQHF